MIWDGATDDDAKIDYFIEGTPGTKGWSHGLRRAINDFEEGKLNIDAVEIQMKLLHELFPLEFWTSDRNQKSGQEFDFEGKSSSLFHETQGSAQSTLGWGMDNRLTAFRFILLEFMKLGQKKQAQGLNPKVRLFTDGQGPTGFG
jgi:hypothetical protein